MRSLFRGLIVFLVFVAGFSSVAGQSPQPGSSVDTYHGRQRALTFTDFIEQPIHVAPVDYRSAMALGPIPADRIVKDGVTLVATGFDETRVLGTLGPPARIADSARQVTTTENNRYFSHLMRATPSTMHYYHLWRAKDRDGWLKSVIWEDSTLSTCQVWFRATEQKGPYTVELIQLTLTDVQPGEVELGNVDGSLTGTVFGTPLIAWDINANIVTIKQWTR